MSDRDFKIEQDKSEMSVYVSILRGKNSDVINNQTKNTALKLSMFTWNQVFTFI